MNVWYLVAALVVISVFGYRFYAKLLALDLFRLDKNYSTPAQSRADGKDYVPTHRHLLFGHHLAAVGGAAMFSAPLAAAAWGWIPAFLCIVVGSAVAAGTYGFGSFWLSLRRPHGLRRTAGELIGPIARFTLFVLSLAALLILIAACMGLMGSILAAFPSAVLPVIAIAFIGLLLGSFLHGRAEFELLPATTIAFAASVIGVWLLSTTPLNSTGALSITIAKTTLFTIDAVSIWAVLFLVYAFQAARLPVWKLMRPRAFLTALLLIVMLLIFYIALGVGHPSIVAPEFHRANVAAPTVLPWIFLAIGPGAFAGWQLLITYHVTAREMRRETDAPYVGYGVAIVQGIVALNALLVAVTGFADPAQWAAKYAVVPSPADYPKLLSAYIDGFARYATMLRIDTDLARIFGAVTIASLTLAVLEGAVRATKHLLAEFAPAASAGNRYTDGDRGRLWLIAIAAMVLAFYDGRGLGGLAAWPFLAITSLWIAVAGFALIAFALRAANQPSLLIVFLGCAIAGLAAWSTVAQLWMWWEGAAWTELAVGGIFLSLAVLTAAEVASAVRRA